MSRRQVISVQSSSESLRVTSPTATNSSRESFDDELPQPVLPWLRPSMNHSNSSLSSIHTMKQAYVKGAVPPVKKWKRWTWHKIWLLVMNCLLFSYGLIAIVLGLCTYFKLYQRALVILVGERTLLNLVTATGAVCLFTSLIGFVGLILNNRVLLTVYNLMLWPCFGLIASIGYTAYRKNEWNIEGKLSFQWHYKFTSDDRANIQSNLYCCGYKTFADFHVLSHKCYPRTLYPGCKFKYQSFTKEALNITWIVAFSMVPVHLLVLFSALLCSNHVNNKFGKGLPPKLYRVDYKGIVAASPNVSSIDATHHGDQLYRRSKTSSSSSSL